MGDRAATRRHLLDALGAPHFWNAQLSRRANPTAGGLVTTGPYRFIRHPIYASICVFVWAGVLAHLSPVALSLGALATTRAIVRLICEEHLVNQQYPEYRVYSLTTKRLLPGVW